MPKIKTRKAVGKRFRVTRKGKVKAKRAFKGHLLTGKTRKRKRSLSSATVLTKTEADKIRTMIPYK